MQKYKQRYCVVFFEIYLSNQIQQNKRYTAKPLQIPAGGKNKGAHKAVSKTETVPAMPSEMIKFRQTEEP